MKKPTIRDLAQQAGVSDTTVSLAFREDSRISAKTRARIMKLARQLNYMPNQAARALREGGTRTLGLLVNDLTNPFYARVVREVEAVAAGVGYQVLVAENQYDASREIANLQRMLEARVQGLLVCFSESTDEMVTQVSELDLPMVALDTVPPGYHGSCVLHDLEAAGRLAADHLLDSGCVAPVFAAPVDRPLSAVTALRRGFNEALAAAGLVPTEPIPGGFDIASGREVLARIQAAPRPIDGVLCFNDLCAIGVLEAADLAGIAVGEELAIMGIDDLPTSGLKRIDLTSIRQPDQELAEMAAKALVEAVAEGTKPTIQQSLHPMLVPRSSTRRTGLQET